jgi:hypothetical protein
MTNSELEPGAVDRWLREGLEPTPGTSDRISKRALSAPPTGRSLPGALWAPLGAAALSAALLVSIFTPGNSTPPMTGEPILITNFGELVTAVDPTGDVWLHAPAQLTDEGSPRLIITLGGTDAE